MGCSKSVHFEPDPSRPGQDDYAIKFFYKTLLLTPEELNNFFVAYNDIDADNSGYVREDEFLTYFSLERTEFNHAVFGMFDFDNSKFLNFFEFTCGVRSELN
jgi:hypothetical protein